MTMLALATLSGSSAERPQDRPLAQDLEVAPLAIRPGQFVTGLRVDASLVPERRLMLAVLEAAVLDYQRCAHGTSGRERRVFATVCAWFDAAPTPWPFSFHAICDALGLDADYLRAGLERWRRTTAVAPMAVRRATSRRMSGTRTRVTVSEGRRAAG